MCLELELLGFRICIDFHLSRIFAKFSFQVFVQNYLHPSTFEFLFPHVLTNSGILLLIKFCPHA